MTTVTRRPQRWDHPFDPDLLETQVEEVLQVAPWQGMARRGGDRIRRILLHDARLRAATPGEVIMREGDYGTSAFFVLQGSVRVLLDQGMEGLLAADVGKRSSSRKGLWQRLKATVAWHREPEARTGPVSGAAHADEDYVPIVIPDVQAVLSAHRTARLVAGQLFGELSALGRTPRQATVVADQPGTRLLEIRWQGLRDIRRAFADFREHVDATFRRRALRAHLLAAPVLSRVGDTPAIREALQEGDLQALFHDALGYAPCALTPFDVMDGNVPIRVEPLAQGERADGDPVRVFACAPREGAGRIATADNADVLAEIRARHPGGVVLIHQAARPRDAIWQWMLGDAEYDDEIARESSTVPARDVDTLVRRLIRVLAVEEVGRRAEFSSYGEFEWSRDRSRPEDEPLIAEEGRYPNGILLVRSGYARVTQTLGGVERTLSYLGPRLAFGFDEIAHNARADAKPVHLQRSLRALGYVDVVFLPTAVVEHHVLPSIPEAEWPDPIVPRAGNAAALAMVEGDGGVTPDRVQFLVDHHLANGTSALLIDLDRCTRCDDCVRACATAHDGNPRFVRHGPVHGSMQVASACMHCTDPVCMIGCPTGAIHRSAAGGEVVIHESTCIGCATCARGCPYDAIRMVDLRTPSGRPWVDERSRPIRKATKCDLCLDLPGGPACERACAQDALGRVDLNDVRNLADWLKR